MTSIGTTVTIKSITLNIVPAVPSKILSVKSLV